jgi:hypothetical protein
VRKLKEGESPWQLNLVHELHHEKLFGKIGGAGDVTALAVSGQQRTLYSGTSTGNVWNWTLPESLMSDVGKNKSIWST